MMEPIQIQHPEGIGIPRTHFCPFALLVMTWELNGQQGNPQRKVLHLDDLMDSLLGGVKAVTTL